MLTYQRNRIVVLLLTLFAGTYSWAQSLVATHFNQFQQCTANRQLDSAFYHAQALSRLNEPILNQLMHDVFAQQFRKATALADTSFDYQLLRKLYIDSTSLPLKRATYPLYWYAAATKSLNDTAITRQIVESFMRAQQRVGERLDNRFDRYALMLYRQLDTQPVYTVLAERLFQQTWNRLEHAVNGIYFSPTDDRVMRAERAYFRYLMAVANTMKADRASLRKDQSEAERYRKGASAYSPDAHDRLAKSAYFYEALFLFDDVNRMEFHQPYVNLLLAKGDTTRAVELLTDMAVGDPGQLPLLKTYYARVPTLASQPFKAYWTQALNAKLKPAEPFRLTTLTNQVLDYTQLRGKWVLIDFWGTWCKPCVAELPKVQAFFEKMAKSNRTDFTMLTVACHEAGVEPVQAFLQKAGYTFPVVMGTEDLIRQFRVGEYPTKVLITPEGNRLKLPFGVDLAEQVKQYMAN